MSLLIALMLAPFVLWTALYARLLWNHKGTKSTKKKAAKKSTTTTPTPHFVPFVPSWFKK